MFLARSIIWRRRSYVIQQQLPRSSSLSYEMISCCALLASKLFGFFFEKSASVKAILDFKTFGKISFPEGLALFHTGFCRHGFGVISFWGINFFGSIIYKLARATAWNHEKKQRAHCQQCGKFRLKNAIQMVVSEDSHYDPKKYVPSQLRCWRKRRLLCKCHRTCFKRFSSVLFMGRIATHFDFHQGMAPEPIQNSIT